MKGGIDWRGKSVAVVGLGLSNVPLARHLARGGASVTAFDRKTASDIQSVCDDLGRLGIRFCLGPGYLEGLKGFDTVFLTPGMKKGLPEIASAREAGAEVSSETRLFLTMCRATTVGITGSAGKTTTTVLTGEMLKRGSGRRVWVGGNIGNPLIESVEEIGENDIAVLELSSFQLETVDSSPSIAVITNVSPNHLDMHSSMDEYIEAKKNIFRFQEARGTAILNGDNEITKGMASECPGKVLFFSRKRETGGAFARDGGFYLPGSREPLMPVKEIRIPGLHNVENALAAATTAANLGVGPQAISEVLRTFPGVEHRLELVRVKDGAAFYNDSIATAPERTIAALHTVEGPVVLILGGYDKHLPFDTLAEEVVDRVEAVVVVGATADKIERAIGEAAARRGNGPRVTRCESFEEAVRAAAAEASPGSNVLLSPACASYDMFRNFEERGRLFQAIVSAL